MTTLYTFDPKTNEHTGSREAAVINGKEMLKSAYATTVVPPAEVQEGYAARWTGTEWEIVEDHRQHTDEHGVKQGGTAYWLPDEGDDWTSRARYMEDLGPLPEGAVLEQPAKPDPTLEEAQTEKLAELSRALDDTRASSKASINSSVGFAINANDTAKVNISGLITYMETTGAATTDFMAFDNTLHEVTLADLKTMEQELIIWGQALYAYKWQTREAIESATTYAEVQAITIDYANALPYYEALLASTAQAVSGAE